MAIKKSVENLKPNMDSIKQYKKTLLELKNRENDLSEVIMQMSEVKDSLEKAKKMRLKEFMEGFELITAKLKEMYQVSYYLNLVNYKRWRCRIRVSRFDGPI